VKAAVLAGPADVVHVDKGYYLLNTTLRDVRARSERTVLINYSLDDWFSLNRKVVGPYLHSTIPLYHHIFASKRYNVAELLAAGACSVSFLPCGYDPLIHRRTEDEGAAGYDVVFVGTYETTRAEMLEALVSRLRPDCTVRVFGNGWQKVSRSSPLRKAIAQRPLLYPERPKVLCSSKIHLNFLRRANRDTFTDRSFELPATGCFMLAERSDEHLALFREGTDAEFFDGVDELIAKVEHYLADDVARMRIAVSGFRCVVSGKHTYYDRFSEIAARVGELVKTVGAEV
jgi:spore maturation protein CgeB